MTAHRHKGLNGKWLTLLGGDGAHTHPGATHTHAELDARLDALEAWIAAHDAAPPEPPEPPVPPPPVPPVPPVPPTPPPPEPPAGAGGASVLPFQLGE